jgi:AraC-like DNA-binding protein
MIAFIFDNLGSFKVVPIVLTLMMAFVYLRENPRSPTGYLLIGLSFALSVYFSKRLLLSMWFTGGSGGWVVFASLAVPFLLWLLAETFFNDEFALKRKHFFWFLGYESVSLLAIGRSHLRSLEASGVGDQLFGSLPWVALVVLGVLIFRATFRGWRIDLINNRRLLRMLVLMTAAVNILTAALIEFFGSSTNINFRHIHESIVVFTASINTMIAFFSIVKLADQCPVKSPTNPSTKKVHGESSLFKKRIEDLVAQGVYTDTEMSLDKMAEKSKIPQYKLRKLIHETYGVKNFSQFLNQFRVSAAAELLRSTDNGEMKITAIAFEVGFNSVSSFNRAFRNTYGMVPSEYRKDCRGIGCGENHNGDQSISV